MSPKIIKFYEFANFRLDRSRKVLLRDDKPVPLTPKVFDTLQILIENAGLLLEKDELMQKIWHDHFVEESNLASNIKMLRKALGDDAAKPRFIETVPRRGYRFIAEVRETFQKSASNNGAEGAFSEPLERNVTVSPAFKKVLLPAAAFLIISLVFIGFWYARSKSVETYAPILSNPFSSEKLSTNGKVFHAVISPDGKNVIYTNGIEGRQSVWLRQLESGNNVEIIPPSDDFYDWLALSPDGNFLYFARRGRRTGEPRSIYRLSIFGGVPQKIAGDTEGWMSVSPDGSRISFVRCPYRDDEFCSLWIADSADGKNERKLVSRPRPVRIGDNKITPDGKSVTFAVGQSQNAANEFGLMEIDIETGKEREITTEKFFDIKNLAWLPDESGLLITASRIPVRHFRIWLVATNGQAEPLTKDSESYARLSLDKEAKILLSTQVKQDFRLLVLNRESPSNPRILADATKVTFASGGKIFFSSIMSGNDEIWSINADGGGQRQLTNNATDEGSPVASPDGNSVFFVSNQTGEVQIWRMNADGSNQAQITKQESGFPIFVSPDSQWLYYWHALDKTLWRVSTRGGEEQLVLNKREHHFAFSSDGLQVAYLEKQGEDLIIEIVSLNDGQVVKTFKIADQKPAYNLIEWMPDKKGVVFISAEPNENYFLRLQPTGGGAPQKLADLGNEEINSFSVAPDGKSFAFVKGDWRHDAVLLKGLK